MAATVPDREPSEITAGDTATWTRSLDDYPASSGWALSYAFLPEGGNGTLISISTTASGSDHLVNEAPSSTVQWGPGVYIGQGYATKTSTGERHVIWEGSLTIKPNFVGAGQIDPRTQAKRIYDKLKDISEKWATKQTSAAVIEGVQFTFKSWEQLEKALNYWGAIVAQQQGKSRRIILTRFTAPR